MFVIKRKKREYFDDNPILVIYTNLLGIMASKEEIITLLACREVLRSFSLSQNETSVE